MSALAVNPDKICTATGLGLIAARRGTAWRITKDAYVQTSGITGVLVMALTESPRGCSSKFPTWWRVEGS